MLLGFLITDIDDWKRWREAVGSNDHVEGAGKPVVRVADHEPKELSDEGRERPSAVDDVETFDDEEESEGELVERPLR